MGTLLCDYPLLTDFPGSHSSNEACFRKASSLCGKISVVVVEMDVGRNRLFLYFFGVSEHFISRDAV